MADSTMTAQSAAKESKDIMVMEQALGGVMFHNFYTDFFTLLDLKGFRKLHWYQKKEEEEELEKLKQEYMEEYGKLPILKGHTVDYWTAHSGLSKKDLTPKKISELVKHSLNEYKLWETKAHENFKNWEMHSLSKDVKEEIANIDELIDFLSYYDYSYESIQYISNKL